MAIRRFLILQSDNTTAELLLDPDTLGGALHRKQEIFTASGTFTLPSTAQALVDYDVIGGGGAGAGVPTAAAHQGRGGGGGGGRKKGLTTLTPGSSYAVVVGAGGVGSTSATGANGGDSSFAGITANGGFGGVTVNGGRSGDGAPPGRIVNIVTGSNLPTATAATPWTGGGGGVIAGSLAHGLDGTSGADGICNGGGGGASATAGLSTGGGDGGGNAGGSNATVVGSGGGGGGSGPTAATRSGGSGYRGEVRILYWDSVP